MLPLRFINLDRAVERRAFMEAQCAALGVPVERVRAVEAGDVAPGEMERLRGSWQRRLSPGEVACFLSHRREWQRVARENRPALILEDDAMFAPGLADVLDALEGLGGAELVNLEDVGKRRFLQEDEGIDLPGGMRAVRCLRDKAGAGAYILWPAGARRVLDAAGAGAGLADAVLHGAQLTAYVCEPPASLQLSVLELRGHRAPIDGRSLLQAPRTRQDEGLFRLRFGIRRTAAQLSLLPYHLQRLRPGVAYRAVRVDDTRFG